MRRLSYFWIIFGITVFSFLPVKAEYIGDYLSVKIDSTKGKPVEEDLYFYSGWESHYFSMDFTNKFSWPANNENYSKFGVKAGFKEYKQLKVNLDYQWNERFRIINPEITHDFELGPDLTLRVEYETENRDPTSERDLQFRYLQEMGALKMSLDRDSWSYELKLAQTRKEYPEDVVENFTKDQLDQDFIWRIKPDLKLKLFLNEATGYFPEDIKLSQDYWRADAGINIEYYVNDYWQLTGAVGAKEEEKGLAPYLDQRSLDLRLKNKYTANLTFNLRVGSLQYDYYSETVYLDPDQIVLEEEDRKSRTDYKATLECRAELRKFELTVETGFFWHNKHYQSALVEDIGRNGLYATLCWNPGKIGVELELAPDGNLGRVNGFYQLKLGYHF